MHTRVIAHIAWRYLWAKKTHNAVHVVSAVSATAVAVVAAAMICVLSVMNGFGEVIKSMFSQFDPDLKIVSVEGKDFSTSPSTFDSLRTLSYVEIVCEVVEETALVEYSDKQLPVVLKGVASNYAQLNHIDTILKEGNYSVFDGAFERAVMGQGLAAQLGVGAFFQSGLHLYAPKRNRKVNLLRPDESFNKETCFMAGIFAVNQLKYDDHLTLVSLDLAQRLFEYAPHQVTSLEVKLSSSVSSRKAKQEIQHLIGPQYQVLDRYEQQEDFFKVLRIEKLLTSLLMVFILLIASFNLVGSLTMLILEKQQTILTFQHLGASAQDIHRIFLFEGWMISAIGAVLGVIAGAALCFLQQHFGWIKLGSGEEYVLSSYPVALVWTDVCWVLLVVLVLGFFAAWIPTNYLRKA